MGISNFWLGNANAVAHVKTLTFATTATGGGNVTVTVAGAKKSVVVPYLNTQTPAVIALAVSVALQNSLIPEFLLHTFGYDPGNPAVVTATMNDAGVPTDLTATVTGVTGITVTVTASSVTGPNWITDPLNWSLGQPNNTHDLIFAEGPACYYGFDAPGFASTPLSLQILGTYETDFGLPDRRAASDGTEFVEFLPRFLDSAILDISLSNGPGNGPTRVNLNPVNAAIVKIFGQNRATTEDNAIVNITTKTGRAITILQYGNSCWFGMDANGDSGVTLTAVEVNGDGAIFRAGPSHTVTLATVKRGTMTHEGTVTAAVMSGGIYRQEGGSLGTIVGTSGTAQLAHKQVSDMTVQMSSPDPAKPPTVDVSQNSLERHLSNTSFFRGGAKIIDPDGSTKLNAVAFDPASLAASSLPAVTVTVA